MQFMETYAPGMHLVSRDRIPIDTCRRASRRIENDAHSTVVQVINDTNHLFSWRG